MLGQTNASGGNTSELETRVDEFEERLAEVELVNKKWLVYITPPPGAGSTTSEMYKDDDGKYLYYASETSSSGIGAYNIKQNGNSISSTSTQYSGDGSYRRWEGITSNTTLLVENSTPFTITFTGSVSTSSCRKVNIYKYGVLDYTVTASSTYTAVNYTMQLIVDRNTRIFRSAGFSPSSDTTLDIYIEEYTP